MLNQWLVESVAGSPPTQCTARWWPWASCSHTHTSVITEKVTALYKRDLAYSPYGRAAAHCRLTALKRRWSLTYIHRAVREPWWLLCLTFPYLL